jgi:hypothetical protein
MGTVDTDVVVAAGADAGATTPPVPELTSAPVEEVTAPEGAGVTAPEGAGDGVVDVLPP